MTSTISLLPPTISTRLKLTTGVGYVTKPSSPIKIKRKKSIVLKLK